MNDWWIDRCTSRAVEDTGARKVADARLRREFADAELAEIKRDEALGKLVPVALFDAQLTGAFSRVRSKLLAIPARVAPYLMGKPKIADVIAELSRQVDEVLTELRDEEVPEDEAEAA